MPIQDIKAIAAFGMQYERARVEAAGRNIANASMPLPVSATKSQVYVVNTEGLSMTFDNLLLGNLDAPQVVTEVADSKYVYAPNDSHADANGMVRRPDIDTTQQMLDVVSATRAYEANMRVYNSASAMGQKALEIGSGR